MSQYIDKDKVAAELEKRRKSNSKNKLNLAAAFEDNYLLSFLDTIETKDVASIWNDARKTIPEDSSNQIICIKEDDLAVATVGKLVRGTKKWAYLNDLLNISDVKTKDVNLEKELETLDRILFDLDGIAIAGTTSYLTVEDVKDIARRFFEMGLNKAKEE